MKLPTFLTLILAISIGVTIGNLASTVITTTVGTYLAAKTLERETKIFEKKATEVKLRNHLQAEKMKKEAAIRDEQNRIENERRRKDEEAKASVRNKLRSTCEFWQNEYNRNRQEYDRANMDMACRAARHNQ